MDEHTGRSVRWGTANSAAHGLFGFAVHRRRPCRLSTHPGRCPGEKRVRSSGVERLPYKQDVGGSKPSAPTFREPPPGRSGAFLVSGRGGGGLRGCFLVGVLQP